MTNDYEKVVSVVLDRFTPTQQRESSVHERNSHNLLRATTTVCLSGRLGSDSYAASAGTCATRSGSVAAATRSDPQSDAHAARPNADSRSGSSGHTPSPFGEAGLNKCRNGTFLVMLTRDPDTGRLVHDARGDWEEPSIGTETTGGNHPIEWPDHAFGWLAEPTETERWNDVVWLGGSRRIQRATSTGRSALRTTADAVEGLSRRVNQLRSCDPTTITSTS